MSSSKSPPRNRAIGIDGDHPETPHNDIDCKHHMVLLKNTLFKNAQIGGYKITYVMQWYLHE
jgi:hypothetical protein